MSRRFSKEVDENPTNRRHFLFSAPTILRYNAVLERNEFRFEKNRLGMAIRTGKKERDDDG